MKRDITTILELVPGSNHSINPLHERPARPRVGLVSLTGQVRPDNQDSFLATPVADNALSIAWGGLVADGAGGSLGGKLASSTAVSAFRELLLRLPEMFPPGANPPDPLAFARTVAHIVDVTLTALRDTDSNLRYMATTMTAALVIEPQPGRRQLLLVHLGDSRAYIQVDHSMIQVSRDHSKASLLKERGVVSDDWNILWGSFPGNRVETYLQVESHELPPECNVLLCSDGLWNELNDEEIARILARYPDPQEAVEALAEAACFLGGSDNISAVLYSLRPEKPAGPGRIRPTLTCERKTL